MICCKRFGLGAPIREREMQGRHVRGVAGQFNQGGHDRALAPVHYCLSRQVVAPLTAAGAAAVRIAARPDEAALLELVGAA